ncbi:hypothetical protein [Pseudoxanthomonas winnipegensis]|uniref:hypothetical protein n=1 Tax=Pseudoxanthomonas winnipegensis TaxID=2480810 RepID=UPI0030F382B4
MADYKFNLINVRLRKINESGELAADQVRNNSWIMGAGLPVQVYRNERDFEFKVGDDGALVDDEDFVADISEADKEWIDNFDLVVGSEIMRCVFANSVTGVLVFEAMFLGRGKRALRFPARFLVFQAGDSAALYSCPNLSSALSAVDSLVSGKALSADVKELNLLPLWRRKPRP